MTMTRPWSSLIRWWRNATATITRFRHHLIRYAQLTSSAMPPGFSLLVHLFALSLYTRYRLPLPYAGTRSCLLASHAQHRIHYPFAFATAFLPPRVLG